MTWIKSFVSYSSAQLLFFAATKVETKLVTKEEKILLGRLVKVYSPRALGQRWLSHWCFKGTQWFQLPHSHQMLLSVSTLALKFKWVLDRSKIENGSVNTDAWCEHDFGQYLRLLSKKPCQQSTVTETKMKNTCSFPFRSYPSTTHILEFSLNGIEIQWTHWIW